LSGRICCLVPAAVPGHAPDRPDAQACVVAFKAANSRIQAVAVRATNLRQYPAAPTAQINLTGREIRAQFGWA